ncbi:MAG: tripartite tricarboxylate transporter substrate binding protein [Betaproteobacteria bacterium]
MRWVAHCKALSLAALVGIALGGWCAAVLGQATPFPQRGKSITLIVPYASGGVTDTGARLMAVGLEKELMTPVVVVNKPGASSQVGLMELLRSKPDGYTLSYVVLPTVITHYAVPGRDIAYTRSSFQPIAMHHFVPQTLSVRADSKYQTLKDLVEAARKSPETISVSDSGLMAVPHTEVLMLERAAGVRFVSVHFTGGAPSVTALLGGHVDALAGATADALQHKTSGAFRVLGVAAELPDKSMPEVPTMKSQGYDVVAASSTGIIAPADTPQNVVDTLTSAIKKVIDSPEHRQKLQELALSPYYLDPAAYTKLWIDTEARMKPILENLQQK